MNHEFGICSCCGKEKLIVNRTHKLCQECNYKRLHGGKTRIEVSREKVQKKKRKKGTGEWELFLEIWSERPHFCVKCGEPLGFVPKPVFFSHIRSKGAHPELRLVKGNIELLCRDCHQKHEFDQNEIK